MSPVIDFTEIPSLDPVPDGDYLAEIVQAKEGTSNAGHPKIDLRWKIISGEFEGRVLFDHMSFAPAALWRTKIVLRAVGFDAGFSGAVEAEDLLGQTATLTVGIEPARTNPDTGEEYPERNRIMRTKDAGASVEDLLG